MYSRVRTWYSVLCLNKERAMYLNPAQTTTVGKLLTHFVSCDYGESCLEDNDLSQEELDTLKALLSADNRPAKDAIDTERRRQVKVEKFDAAHDDDHFCGELSKAAVCYFDVAVEGEHLSDETLDVVQELWPFDWKWFKPYKRLGRSKRWDMTNVDVVRCLVKAGALVEAEKARLKRFTEKIVARLTEVLSGPS